MGFTLKLVLNGDTRRFNDDIINLQSLNQFVIHAFKISTFQLRYFDDEQDEITIANDSELQCAIQIAIDEERKSLKIYIKHIITSAEPAKSIKTVKTATYKSMYDIRMKQEQQILDLLNANKPTFNPPNYLHKKLKQNGIWKTQREKTKKISKQTKKWNETVIEINSQVELDRNYWNSASINDEITFRIQRIDKTLKQIEAIQNKLSDDNVENLKQNANALRHKHNKCAILETKQKNIKTNVENSENIIHKIITLENDINHRMISILRIQTSDDKPFSTTIRSRANFFDSKNETVIKEAEMYNYYKYELKKLNLMKSKASKYIKKCQSHKSWETINCRANSKQNSNKKRRESAKAKYWKRKGIEAKEQWDERKQIINKRKEKEKNMEQEHKELDIDEQNNKITDFFNTESPPRKRLRIWNNNNMATNDLSIIESDDEDDDILS